MELQKARESAFEDDDMPDPENEQNMPVDRNLLRSELCWCVPHALLYPEDADDAAVDFKTVKIADEAGQMTRIFYQEVVAGTWRGFTEMQDHALMKAANEHNLWNDDDWESTETNQMNLIANLTNLIRPNGIIPFPRATGFEIPDWTNFFYDGHASVGPEWVDAEEVAQNYQEALQAHHEELARQAMHPDNDDEEEEDDPQDTIYEPRVDRP